MRKTQTHLKLVLPWIIDTLSTWHATPGCRFLPRVNVVTHFAVNYNVIWLQIQWLSFPLYYTPAFAENLSMRVPSDYKHTYVIHITLTHMYVSFHKLHTCTPAVPLSVGQKVNCGWIAALVAWHWLPAAYLWSHWWPFACNLLDTERKSTFLSSAYCLLWATSGAPSGTEHTSAHGSNSCCCVDSIVSAKWIGIKELTRSMPDGEWARGQRSVERGSFVWYHGAADDHCWDWRPCTRGNYGGDVWRRLSNYVLSWLLTASYMFTVGDLPRRRQRRPPITL